VTAEEMIAGLSVEFGDKLAGGGEHDRVESCGPVGHPGREGIVGSGGDVTDVNAAAMKVEVQCLWFAFSEGECGCSFGRVGEAMQLGQAEGAVIWVMSRRTPPAPIAESC
jgi:hypothetical protein